MPALRSRGRCRAAVPGLAGAVPARYLGAARVAVHQGPPRRQPDLPLVVPDGDLRQLRPDGERRAATGLPYLPARLLPEEIADRAAGAFPDYPGPGDRPERLPQQAGIGEALPDPEAGQAAVSRALPADAGTDGEVLRLRAVHQLPAVLRRLSA